MKSVLSVLALVASVALATGCAMPGNIVVPERFATIKEVYPEGSGQIISASHPSGSYRQANFAVPYEDVFRAVSESAGQALLSIESSNKNSGLILASKAAKVRNTFDSQINQAYEAERRHFFAIVVKERGAESTDVQIVSKVQTSCQYNTWFGEDVCGEEAKVKYATDFWHSAMTEMNNLITFIRNNLYAAGLL